MVSIGFYDLSLSCHRGLKEGRKKSTHLYPKWQSQPVFILLLISPNYTTVCSLSAMGAHICLLINAFSKKADPVTLYFYGCSLVCLSMCFFKYVFLENAKPHISQE